MYHTQPSTNLFLTYLSYGHKTPHTQSWAPSSNNGCCVWQVQSKKLISFHALHVPLQRLNGHTNANIIPCGSAIRKFNNNESNPPENDRNKWERAQVELCKPEVAFYLHKINEKHSKSYVGDRSTHQVVYMV